MRIIPEVTVFAICLYGNRTDNPESRLEIKMPVGDIRLSPALTTHQMDLIMLWLRNPRNLTLADWPKALTAFDLLRTSTVEWEGQSETFGDFYEHFMDVRYATPCLKELMSLVTPESDGYSVLAAYARRLRQDLLELFPERPLSLPARGLLAHCLYWWNSFGKGYLYEITILADLRNEKIEFTAHDLSDPDERRSAYDLIVLQRRGDIKTSTYFLHVARSFPLQYDFYITCLFSVIRRVWQNVVILRPEFWDEIDGETHWTILNNVLSVFPAVAAVFMRGNRYVVVDYAIWKQKVKTRQYKGGE